MLGCFLFQVNQLTEQTLGAAKPAMVYCSDVNTENQALKNEFEKAAQNASNYYDLNCSQETKLCQSLHLATFPSILFLKHDLIYQYTGEPVAKQMLEFSNVLSQPMLIEVPSFEVFRDSLRHYDVRLGIFVTGDDENVFESNLAFLHGRVPVGFAKSEEMSISVVDGQQTFVLNSSEIQKIVHFAKIHENPLLQKVTAEERELEAFLSEHDRILALFCLDLQLKEHKKLGKNLREWLYEEANTESEVIDFFRFGYANASEVEGVCEMVNATPGLLVVDQRAAPVLLYKHHVQQIEQTAAFLTRVINGEEKAEKIQNDQPNRRSDHAASEYKFAARWGAIIFLVFLSFKLYICAAKCRRSQIEIATAETAEEEQATEEPEGEPENVANEVIDEEDAQESLD